MSTSKSTELLLAELLRHWRQLRRVTQEELAEALGHSVRHLSFLETARARPSRGTLRNLIGVLGVPQIDGDQLMRLAGFAPEARGDVGDWDNLPPTVEQFISRMVGGVWPNPAAINDVRHRVVRGNLLLCAYLSQFAHLDEIFDDGYISWQRLVFHPKGLRTIMSNWEEYAVLNIQLIHRERYRVPEIGERLYQDVLELTDLPLTWKKLSDDDRIDGGAPLALQSPFGEATLWNVNFMMTGHPSRYTQDFPDFLFSVQTAVDDNARSVLVKMHDIISVDTVHPNLKRALVPTDA